VPWRRQEHFIEALGLLLIERGHRVAVLTIDPSSSVSGGSILGDKTRMERLSIEERSLHPDPARPPGHAGRRGREDARGDAGCEAAGYDVVIVETSASARARPRCRMTDMFVLLQLPNAGDDLQAIKKGVMELADLVVINKADSTPLAATAQAHHQRAALFGSPRPDTHACTQCMQSAER
jgi:LAO/AO transport system kinase